MTEPCNPINCPMEEKIDLLLEKTEAFNSAFVRDPDGSIDLVGHRRYHEARIAAAKAEEEFWRSLKYDVTKRGIMWVVVTLLGLASAGLLWKLAVFVQKIPALPVK